MILLGLGRRAAGLAARRGGAALDRRQRDDPIVAIERAGVDPAVGEETFEILAPAAAVGSSGEGAAPSWPGVRPGLKRRKRDTAASRL
jgi:hypothetical protein